MVFYFTNNAVTPPATYFMGKDKYENEDLIKWGWPEDVWFHVDKLSSAHVYLRLNPGQTIKDVPQQVINDACQLVKANSIQGHKLSEVDVVYTMWANLKKTPGMEVGQVSFFNDNEVYKVKVEKQNPVVNRLEKTKKEEQPNLREQRERRDAEERAEKKQQLREQKEREKADERKKKEEAELRSYSSLMKSENMKDNQSGYDSDEFW
ncbi:coiled-coil domain-containing protein 25 [Planococcus citri]|uniref:coiled-coil domain-containing protein 25 n=1 Tax=Planococcus citri TaxID=170843 RepID=UPI0031FA4850